MAMRRWTEHVVIGEPFGILGMDLSGAVSWLQLEPASGLEALAEVAQVEGVPAEGLEDIRAGRMLDVHADRTGRKLLLPDRHLLAFDWSRDHDDGHRRGGQLGQHLAGLVRSRLAIRERQQGLRESLA